MKVMPKELRERLKPKLKPKSTESLQGAYLKGAVFAFTLQSDDDFKRVAAEMYLIRRELRSRNIKVVKQPNDIGMVISFAPIEDKRAKEPVTMRIPSVHSLIHGRIATDLPKHGYLSLPTIHLPQ
jgi:hypothetical protein